MAAFTGIQPFAVVGLLVIAVVLVFLNGVWMLGLFLAACALIGGWYFAVQMQPAPLPGPPVNPHCQSDTNPSEKKDSVFLSKQDPAPSSLHLSRNTMSRHPPTHRQFVPNPVPPQPENKSMWDLPFDRASPAVVALRAETEEYLSAFEPTSIVPHGTNVVQAPATAINAYNRVMRRNPMNPPRRAAHTTRRPGKPMEPIPSTNKLVEEMARTSLDVHNPARWSASTARHPPPP